MDISKLKLTMTLVLYIKCLSIKGTCDQEELSLIPKSATGFPSDPGHNFLLG